MDNGWTAPTGNSSTTLLEPDTRVLAVANGQVYFPIGNDTDAGCYQYELVRVSTSGGPVQRLLGTLIASDANCGEDIPDAEYLPDSGGTQQIDALSLAVDGNFLYWLNEDSGSCGTGDGYSVWKLPLGGGLPAEVTSGLTDPVNFTIAGSSIYIVDDMNDDVESFPVLGGSSAPLVAAQMLPWAMASDSSYVYWTSLGTNQDDGTISRYPIGGGASTTLVRGLAAPAALAVDDENVYWVDTVCDAVFKAPK
jgi:hypothetical protein